MTAPIANSAEKNTQDLQMTADAQTGEKGEKLMLKKFFDWRKTRKAELFEMDRLWHEDKKQYGWELPKSYWFLRLPFVRYFRFVFYGIRLNLWARMWNNAGVGFGGIINEYDEWRKKL